MDTKPIGGGGGGLLLGVTPSIVVVHPLVLLSVVDNYNRAARDTSKRVVGVLLGERDARSGRIDVTNSFAVPFEEEGGDDMRAAAAGGGDAEEEEEDEAVWFFDHAYAEEMVRLFKKINARELVVGWYSTGSRVKKCDLGVHDVMRRYAGDNGVMAVIDVKHEGDGLPLRAFRSVEEVEKNARSRMVFVPVPAEVGAYEAEEIGVEHLLRDVRDATVSTLAGDVDAKAAALRGLAGRLEDVKKYLDGVGRGELKMNHEVLAQLQDVLNLLPNVRVEEMAKSITTKTNDMMLPLYVSSIVRSVLALHNLVNNKIENRERDANSGNATAAAADATAGKTQDKENGKPTPPVADGAQTKDGDGKSSDAKKK